MATTMKPRLEVAALTLEDKAIWNRLADRNPSGTEWYNSTTQDRRDAELMYRIEICRQYEREHPEKFEEYRGWGWVHAMIASVIDGGTVCFQGSDITYCA